MGTFRRGAILKGVDILRRDFKALPMDIKKDVLTATLAEAAIALAAKFEAAAPRGETGKLRASMEPSRVRIKGDETTVKAGSKLFYAPFVERGHAYKKDDGSIGNVPGKFFMKKTEEAYEPELLEALSTRLGHYIEQRGKKG